MIKNPLTTPQVCSDWFVNTYEQSKNPEHWLTFLTHLLSIYWEKKTLTINQLIYNLINYSLRVEDSPLFLSIANHPSHQEQSLHLLSLHINRDNFYGSIFNKIEPTQCRETDSLFCSNIAFGQEWFLNIMERLGYKGANQMGQCFGLANMAMHAFLAQDMQSFNSRIDALSKLNFDDIDALTQAPLGTPIPMSCGFYLRPLDIYAFFDGVQLLQDPHKFQHVLQDRPQADCAAAPYILPVYLSNPQNEPVFLASFCGVYTERELFIYLDKLQHYFTGPVSLILNSSSHCINLNLDRNNRQWVLVDANRLNIRYFYDSQCMQLARAIIDAFGGVLGVAINHAIFNTQMVVSRQEKDRCERDILSLNRDLLWHEIQKISFAKARLVDVCGANVSYVAAQYGHYQLIPALHAAGADLNSLGPCEVNSVYVAAQNGHHRVIAALCAAGVNIYSLSNVHFAPLLIAGKYGHREVLIVFDLALFLLYLNYALSSLELSFNSHKAENKYLDCILNMLGMMVERYHHYIYNATGYEQSEKYTILTASRALSSILQMADANVKKMQHLAEFRVNLDINKLGHDPFGSAILRIIDKLDKICPTKKTAPTQFVQRGTFFSNTSTDTDVKIINTESDLSSFFNVCGK